MKRTLKVNIAKVVFFIDEDAYQVLRNYLNQVEQFYAKTQSGNEVIMDIEIRLAELFEYRVGEAKQAIDMKDVHEVIAILGNPRDFEHETDEVFEDDHLEKPLKRLYRDPDNKVLGGVCSGLGIYLNIDPVIVRVAFVAALLLFGAGTLFYILLWIIVPEAKTTSQKLEMRGEAITISNIENSIKQEFERVKRRWTSKNQVVL